MGRSQEVTLATGSAPLLLTPEFIGKFKFNKNGINFQPTNILLCLHTKMETDKISEFYFSLELRFNYTVSSDDSLDMIMLL